MTTLDRLHSWHQAGVITGAQHRSLSTIVTNERFSLFLELNALLYLGVISLVVGLGWTFQTYFSRLGDPFILGAFTLIWTGGLYFCFRRASAYSNREVESPNLAFDYVLYLACLVLSAELTYIEFRFHPFRGAWDHYLLFTAAAFGLLAYRFDNRLVLSLALTAFAGWFGLQNPALKLRAPDALRLSAIVYSALVAGTGTAMHRRGIKPHFIEAYLHVAANVAFAALVSGIGDGRLGLLYLTALLAIAGGAVWLGVRTRRFAFVAYGAVYGYIGLSYRIVRPLSDEQLVFAYFIVTGAAMVALLVGLARRFGRE